MAGQQPRVARRASRGAPRPARSRKNRRGATRGTAENYRRLPSRLTARGELRTKQLPAAVRLGPQLNRFADYRSGRSARCTANGENVVLSARNRATNGSDLGPGAEAPRWVAALPPCVCSLVVWVSRGRREWQAAPARGSREPGQALTGAALSGVLLCGGRLPLLRHAALRPPRTSMFR